MSDSLKLSSSIFEESKNTVVPRDKINTMTLEKMNLNPDEITNTNTVYSDTSSFLAPDSSSTVIQQNQKQQQQPQYQPLENYQQQQQEGSFGSQQQQQGSFGTPEPEQKSFIPAEYLTTEWYFVDAKAKQQGPYSFAQLKKLFKDGVITQNTHVFGGDLSSWTKIVTNPKLLGIFKMD